MKKTVAIVLLLLVFPALSYGQCSMCKAVAETANGGGIATGINYGILYLMVFPYLIVSGIAYRIYRSRKAAK